VIPRRLNPAKADIHPSRATIPLAPAAPQVPSVIIDRAHRSKHTALKRPIWNGSDRKDAPQSIAHAAIGQHPDTPRRSSNHNSP
jgi:hypothetical protein